MLKTIAHIAFLVSLIITLISYYYNLDWQWEAFWTLLLAITAQGTE